jgi:hypothetical protein
MKAIVVIWLLMLGAPWAQKERTPASAPIDVEYNDPPEHMKTGDEATTTIVFRATSDIDRLEVAIVPDDGLQLLSTRTEAVFTDVKEDDGPELEVKVKLTDPKGSSLNVSYVTVSGSRRGVGAIVIDYGEIVSR